MNLRKRIHITHSCVDKCETLAVKKVIESGKVGSIYRVQAKRLLNIYTSETK